MASAMTLFGQAYLPSAFAVQPLGSTNNVSISNIGAPSNLLNVILSRTTIAIAALGNIVASLSKSGRAGHAAKSS